MNAGDSGDSLGANYYDEVMYSHVKIPKEVRHVSTTISASYSVS